MGIAFGVIQKIANSVASDVLMPIFDELVQGNRSSPAIRLISLAIKLESIKEIPKNDIKELYESLSSNVISKRMLQEVVLQHLYLHHVEYRDKQWISDSLHISMQTQRIIEGQRQRKLLER